MEHYDLYRAIQDMGLDPGDTQVAKMKRFARMVIEHNRLVNLTGCKTIPEAERILVAESIRPISMSNVPRGTLLMDMGTGSGVPGVPILLAFSGISGILVDSNGKRTEFVKRVIDELRVPGCRVMTARVEDLGHDDRYREKVDLLVSRGFAHPYVAMEMGAPLVKKGGRMLVYARGKEGALPGEMLGHMRELGLDIAGDDPADRSGIGEGLLWVKKEQTPSRYPRRFPVIKREASRIDIVNGE
ncbi:MAG: 16S rRNA (guanine(527)-N(7))-methyltransferase RsmG [Spirochaetota bacterium]